MSSSPFLLLERTPSMTRLHDRITQSPADATAILLAHWRSHEDLNAILLHDVLREVNEIQTIHASLGPRLDTLYNQLLRLGVQHHMNDAMGDSEEHPVPIASSVSPTPPPTLRPLPVPQTARRGGRRGRRVTIHHTPLTHAGLQRTRATTRHAIPPPPTPSPSDYYTAPPTPSIERPDTPHTATPRTTTLTRRFVPRGVSSQRSIGSTPRDNRCFTCGAATHWALNCPGYQCVFCRQVAPGHYSRDCPWNPDQMYYNQNTTEEYYEHDEVAEANMNGEPGY